VPIAAEDKGVRVVGYQSDMRRYAPRAQLTSIVHQWGGHYTRVAQSVLDGRWQARPVWGGLKDGYLALAPLAADVPAATAALVQQRQREIVAGRFHPFTGRLVDQAGTVRQSAGTLGDDAIATMDWFVQGVSGSLPARR
jgi:simple sugar transport system substrate-binding protein